MRGRLKDAQVDKPTDAKRLAVTAANSNYLTKLLLNHRTATLIIPKTESLSPFLAKPPTAMIHAASKSNDAP
jgi:hypothetical protein